MDSNLIIYNDDTENIHIEAMFEDETVWLNQKQISELFNTSRENITAHIKNIYLEGELNEEATSKKFLQVREEGNRAVKREITSYNLDLILSVGYRVKSKTATQFRIWATELIKEYLKKGFVMNDDRLKNLGGGNYWKELLTRIRDIRSSEKVMYRQVLDLYATAIDYDPKADASVLFFKIVQNKLHFGAHGHTASEVIYYRVDSDKPFAGLTSFKGKQPTQAEAMIAKNYLTEQELRVLNNLVSAYFDLAELNAIEEKEMRMTDYLTELDNILKSTGRNVLEGAGKVTTKSAQEKAKLELKRYKAKTLDPVEEDYLELINRLEKQAKKESRKK
ncbi:toxin Fic [Lactococcus piscium]|uniref:Toxin Fic n=1 Tax=Pseudolactococcus piscium TaxID=1364 RepID=A0A2A5RWD5_9LACT|nr:virulence RhuM family protein [Lactococcus piscium]PCS05535.1 toxin Fic [Lactococcus piscium]